MRPHQPAGGEIHGAHGSANGLCGESYVSKILTAAHPLTRLSGSGLGSGEGDGLGVGIGGSATAALS